METLKTLLFFVVQVGAIAILLGIGYVGVQQIDKLALRWASQLKGNSKCGFWDIGCHATKGGPLLFEKETCHNYGVDLAYLFMMPLSGSGKAVYFLLYPVICLVSVICWIYRVYAHILGYIYGIIFFIPRIFFNAFWAAFWKTLALIARVLQIAAVYKKIMQAMPICIAVSKCLALLDRATNGPKLVTVGILVYLSLFAYAVFKLGLYVISMNVMELYYCETEFTFGILKGAADSLPYWKAALTLSFVS